MVKWNAVGRQQSINLETDKVSIRSRDERSSKILPCLGRQLDTWAKWLVNNK